MDSSRNDTPHILRRLGLEPIDSEWRGIDAVLPLVEKMRADGAVVIIKFDGERQGPNDAGPYTIAVIGKVMNDEPLRRDSHSLEDGLRSVIVAYARRFWGYGPPS